MGGLVHAADKPNVAGGLKLTLKPVKATAASSGEIALQGVFENVGTQPLAMTFWWHRSMRITDEKGKTMTPGKGPVLPCGAAEMLTAIAPGQRHERAEPLLCTQCAGVQQPVGWSYQLPTGKYRVVLVYENPPRHGYQPNA